MKELIEKLRTFTVPELCDGCAEPDVMDYRIKPAFGTPHICGRAVTLDIPEGIAGMVPDAIMELKEGDILVIAGKGWQKSAYWGDHRSVCAKMLGAEGVIIDGLYRDKEGCEAAGLPVFALGLCARSSLQKQEGQINVPVECAGAAVNPGDIICADQNGVIVIHPEDAEEIMAKAQAKRDLQEELEQWMRETGNVVPRIRKPSSVK
ncbi:MAG: RraA family protein [Erysipelotrichaceae bacterium]|nr:RraA family protein [Erysipelotrichaceae bacterium]